MSGTVRVEYALVAAEYSMLGLLFLGFYLYSLSGRTFNTVAGQKLQFKLKVYAIFRGILAPPMILAHLIYLWPMRFDEHAAEQRTTQMASLMPCHADNLRDCGATVYNNLYLWLCNGLLPAVFLWGTYMLLAANRHDESVRYDAADSGASEEPLGYPYLTELLSQGMFAAVLVARFLSLLFGFQWFYLAWADPWPTIGNVGYPLIVFADWAIIVILLSWYFGLFTADDLPAIKRIVARTAAQIKARFCGPQSKDN